MEHTERIRLLQEALQAQNKVLKKLKEADTEGTGFTMGIMISTAENLQSTMQSAIRLMQRAEKPLET